MIFPFIGLELYGQVAKENYQDSIFLDLRGDLRDPEVLGRDWEVYIRAYRRVQQHMRFQIEGQAIRFVWDVKSGSELKVRSRYSIILSACGKSTIEGWLRGGMIFF